MTLDLSVAQSEKNIRIFQFFLLHWKLNEAKDGILHESHSPGQSDRMETHEIYVQARENCQISITAISNFKIWF